ncbi:MAG TPA: 50S ribosomal protein L6 [Phycisphaerales bacterium]|nr:50S ribosomal protein L6 [Phycisphaerales bacterium]
MSRLGKKPIPVPANVTVAVNGRVVTVSSGAKKLEMTHRPEVKVAWKADEKNVVVSLDDSAKDNPEAPAYWGTTRALIQNMINGVTKGYEITLEINGVGYVATVTGKGLELKLGFANTLIMPIPKGVEVAVDKNIVKVRGADRQAVGQFASEMRAKRPPEPYNAKGIKYSTETIKRKQGKAFGA